MAHEISTGKSICILGTVIACFAVLWPNVFYPMLKGSVTVSSDGCCDVLLDKDVNGVKLVSELCTHVLKLTPKYSDFLITNRLNKDAVKQCRNVVLETCDIDINVLLKETIELDLKYKNVLDNIRTFNKSLCLKYHFDITLDLLGTPHRVKKYNITTATNYYRQERKSRANTEGLHPAFRKTTPPIRRERNDVDAAAMFPDEDMLPPAPIPTIQEGLPGKKPPVPGMRPTVGGNGYIAQQKGSGTMGILMPMYTLGIVGFFTYTILRLLSKKPENRNNFMHDPDFCKNVFTNSDTHEKSTAADPASKLGDIEIDQLRRRLAETEATMDRIVKQMNLVSMTLTKPLNENVISSNVETEEVKPSDERAKTNNEDVDAEKLNGVIEVVGMEVNESCENGKPWKQSSPPPPKKISAPAVTPQEILLHGNVPVNSQILVSDAHTENVSTESLVILESKVTLNVISPELENEDRNKKAINGESYNTDNKNGHSINGDHSAQKLENDDDEEVEEVEEIEEEEEEEVEEVEVEEEEYDDEGDEEEEEEKEEVVEEIVLDHDNKIVNGKTVQNVEENKNVEKNTEL